MRLLSRFAALVLLCCVLAPIAAVAVVTLIVVGGLTFESPAYGKALLVLLPASVLAGMLGVSYVLFVVNTRMSLDATAKRNWSMAILFGYPVGVVRFWYQHFWQQR